MATLGDHNLTRFSETSPRRGFWIVEYSPEKAGVGGSTPSLATMFSISCTPPKTAPRTTRTIRGTKNSAAGICQISRSI